MKSLASVVLVCALVVFAFMIELRFAGTGHDRATDFVALGALVLAVALALPTKLERAVSIVKPVLPWRSSRHSVQRSRLPPEGEA